MVKSVLRLVVIFVTLSGCSVSAVQHGPGAANEGRAEHGAYRAAQTIAMTHILDFENIGEDGHRTDLSWSALSPFLTADEPGGAESGDASASGISVGWYTNAAIQHANGPLYTRDETTFAHDCVNNRITSIYEGQIVYLMDPHSPRLLRLWVRDADAALVQDGYHIDYVAADSSDDLRKFTARPCNNVTHTGFDEGDWTRATAKMYSSFEQQTGLPILANALYTPSSGGGNRIAPGIGLAASVWGEATEECYADTSGSGLNPGPADRTWLTEENAEIAIMATGKAWFCSGDYEDSTNAAAAIPQRMYQLASFLLTYQPAQAYLKQPWVTASNFRQNKETHLIALEPVVAQPSNISALLTSTGVYAREYSACYIAGAIAGPCVAIVNPSRTATLPRGYANYAHTLVASGTDPFDGGTIHTNGIAAPAVLPSQSAYILFP